MSDKNLIKLQAGKETVWGTSVTDTVKRMLIDDAKLTPLEQVKRFQEMRGSMVASYVQALQKIAGGYTYKGAVSYEDAPYELDAMLGTVVPTGAGPYVYAYLGPIAALTAPRIQSLRFGESVDGIYLANGCVPTKLHYSIANADALMFDTEGVCKQVASGASFAALSDRTVTPVMGGDFAVYVDAFGGTIGTTALPANVYSLDLVIESKRDLRHYLGAYTPGRYREPERFDFTLKLVLEFAAVSKAYLDAMLGLASGGAFQKLVRLKATSGTNIFQIDLAGVSEDAPEIWGYEKNVQTVDITLKGSYEGTFANMLKASVTNSVATMA